MGKSERKREANGEWNTRVGREEINLLEWGIFSAGTKVDRKTKGLVFEQPVWDPRVEQPTVRRLTVAFSSMHGRPTASDDQVMLALMTISWLDRFQSPRVFFTRYQICSLLHWADEGRNYERIERAFSRIRGVHLDFDRSFYDKLTASWVDRRFGLIDDAELYDREHYALLKQEADTERPKSWFRWSEPFFESMKSGCIKKIDLELLRGFDDSFAKRLFRWLDKNFYKRRSIRIPLHELAYQKLGMSGHYTNSRIKQLLRPAFRELETSGTILPAGDSDRFRPAAGKRGAIDVHFVRPARPKVCARSTNGRTKGENLLGERGVGENVAKELAKTAAEQETTVETRIEVLDWLVETGDRRVSKSQTGYLVSSIRENYALPDRFLSKARRERLSREIREEEARKKRNEQQSEQMARDEQKSKLAPFWQFWGTLNADAKLSFEQEAVAAASPVHRQSYLRQMQRENGMLEDEVVQVPFARPSTLEEMSLCDSIRVEVLLRHFERVNNAEEPKGLQVAATGSDDALELVH